MLFLTLLQVFLLLLILFGPFLLTLANVRNLIAKQPSTDRILEIITLVAGLWLTVLLYISINFKDYEEYLHTVEGEHVFHAPVSSQYHWILLSIMIAATFAYFFLTSKGRKLPPIPIGFLLAILYFGCFICILWIIQLSAYLMQPSFTSCFILVLCIYPINFLILSASLLRKFLKEYSYEEEVDSQLLQPSLTAIIHRTIRKSISLPLLGFLCLLPLCALGMLFLILFRQQPDAIIKAFTETSDWLLSTKESRILVEVASNDHYLCTVAVGGHKSIVKPLRYGLRQQKRIVVNRQLCIANAFEDLIKEKTPHVHQVIRHLYDTYGYPLSKLIQSPIKADITYVFMKPLEWIFLFTLYCFDQTPENRINLQYLPQDSYVKYQSHRS